MMKKKHIFISHSDRDHTFIDNLRKSLELQGLEVWVDNKQVRAGDGLERTFKEAIETARAFIVVFSINTFNSGWILKEVQHALKVRKKQGRDYVVIPLLLEGVGHDALHLYFQEETAGIEIEIGPGGISEAMPRVLAALGERSVDVIQPMLSKPREPKTELLLELTEPYIADIEGKQRAQAVACLKCIPAGQGEREVEGRFRFTAPMGPIEREELRWYLERYYSWPSGVFQERAEKVEALLPVWGKGLYDAVFNQGQGELNHVLLQWQKSRGKGARRFTVYVDKKLVAAKDDEQGASGNEAATALLTLPWELLNDGTGYLFQGGSPVQVRRRLPNTRSLDSMVAEPPIRILLVSPRPEDDRAVYIDHRISALPLVSALESLGEMAELTVLARPTFKALGEELFKAKQGGTPYHVVHFDGHGVFDKKLGLGGLCFEDPQDITKLQNRNSKIIDAEEIAAVMRDYRIPLVFLEACQSARAEKDPGASVAATLLDQGVASVVAMSHSVLVETARRFVSCFYGQLALGQRVGDAMLAGRQELHGNAFRFKIFGAGKLELQDWFVPVLYQEKEDVQLLTDIPSRRMQEMDQKALARRLGFLPGEPAHSFVGRSRELLSLERLLAQEKVNHAVVLGQGGEGKTTLAAELARWLVRTGRFKRAVFVSMEGIYDVRAVVDQIGRQLLPNYSVAQYEETGQALLPIEGQLREEATLVLLDNMESILPPKEKEQTSRLEPGALEEFFTLCSRLNGAADTALLFTSRQALPQPFDSGKQTVTLSRLDKKDAVDLVHQAMIEAGLTPQEEDDGAAQPEVEALVQSVNCHARSLVLLAPYIGRLGVRHTTENLGRIMADLHKEYPDERERSLYASVRLSLERVAPELQAKIKPLGAFQGGANLFTFQEVLQLAEDERETLLKELIQLNLAEPVAYGFLRFHPALCPFLWGQMTAEEQKDSTTRWAESMKQLSGYLYGEFFKDAQLALNLTTLELPNLMRLLHHVRAQQNPETTVKLATRLEQLISNLGRKDLLAVVSGIREEETKKLGAWSHTRFVAFKTDIERLLGSGDLPQALKEAQALLEKSLQEGVDAYDGADYDTAVAYFLLGRVLRLGGASDAALTQCREAYHCFQGLADQGNTSAAGMASASLTEIGDCLLFLGRLDEAALAYEEGIKRSETLKDDRQVAVGKGQLGTVRMYQKRYDDALETYKEAIEIFTTMGEPGSVAVFWHQIGNVHQEAGQYEASEQAYRKSLAIKVQQNNPAGEANTLLQLGNLYNKMGRLEESVVFLRQAADTYVAIKSVADEGLARSNLANLLIKLNRYAEAREEILRAIKCKEPYGHASEPWKAWMILHDLEQAEGNAGAASQARQKAFELYLAYRNDGGENHEFGGRLCHAFRQAMTENKTGEMATLLLELANDPDTLPVYKLLVTKLQAILAGSRDPELWQDTGLFYMDAVEIKLLVEELD